MADTKPPLESPCCGTDQEVRPDYGYAPNPTTYCGVYYNEQDPRCWVNGVEFGCKPQGTVNLATTGGKIYCTFIVILIVALMGFSIIGRLIGGGEQEEREYADEGEGGGYKRRLFLSIFNP
eukprot:gnl/TRDRNA2_/TRDRNA2_40285_c0_seq1.p1 gnl/TRDRNA2_/TRDRNA2_40285_c0~~gnl/TRDRNA2_/TRDRNA2_40285_c0_seq1.p1  ORF type:complete len:121 (-),score=11.91 gnl/TRDRNA2_/TRDRNA2_40285_c0_seq1:83-445(-)